MTKLSEMHDLRVRTDENPFVEIYNAFFNTLRIIWLRIVMNWSSSFVDQ